MKVSIPDCFMAAFAAGLCFGLVYEALRFIRLLARFKYVVFVCDLLFFVAAAAAVCRLSEFLGNYVRLYTVLGFGAGVFTYIVTLGRLFNLIENAVVKAVHKVMGKLFHKIAALCGKISGKILQKTKTAFVQIHDNWFKSSKKRSEPLISSDKMVYNNVGKYISEKGAEKYVIKANVTKNP